MSKRCVGDEGKHIKLLCVRYKGLGHYLVITDMAKIMKNTAGKIFYNCSICNHAFFTRSALLAHSCDAVLSADHLQWSRYDLPPSDAENPVSGTCKKCMLKFVTPFESTFHTNHCLMEGRTGYRHVHCIPLSDCKEADDNTPVLRGVNVDLEKEECENQKCHLLFADFESSIDPETGEHTMMSYGLYDVPEKTFVIRYSLDEFVHELHEIVCLEDTGRIHVYFHNAMNYDANFILRYVLANAWCKHWSISALMKSSSRLQKLRFTFVDDSPAHRVRTIEIGDTFLFITMSLERIVSCIRKPDLAMNMKNFKLFFTQFKKQYPWVSDWNIDQILKKNLFPYKFFTDASKLDTPIEDFLKK